MYAKVAAGHTAQGSSYLGPWGFHQNLFTTCWRKFQKLQADSSFWDINELFILVGIARDRLYMLIGSWIQSAAYGLSWFVDAAAIFSKHRILEEDKREKSILRAILFLHAMVHVCWMSS